LNGRIQTRIFALILIGGFTQLWLTPLLPQPAGMQLTELYAATYALLVSVIMVGVAWELIYHLLMQFRWEKDWPTLFGLLTMLNEGLLIWLLVKGGLVPFVPAELGLGTFVVDFAIVWLLTWIWVNGPMRVMSVHWRFRGGRLV